MSHHRPQPKPLPTKPPKSSTNSSTSTRSSQEASETLLTRSLSSMTISTSSVHGTTYPKTRTPLSTAERSSDDRMTAPSTELHLPAEVLQHIFSFLCHQDLLRVIFVNKWYSQNGNTILYRNIDLASDDPYVAATLDLLENAPTLSRGLVSAKLTTRNARGPSSTEGVARWIQSNFFKHSTNLQSLHLRGLPFSSPQQWQTFGETLRRVCVKLDDIHFEPMTDDLPLRDLPLSGLTRLSLHPESDMKWPIQPLLQSFSTLTSVLLNGRVEHVNGNAFDHLLSMHLPKLTSIELGCLVSALPDTNSKLTRFLFRHPLLERLSLGREDLRLTESDPIYRLQLPEDERTRQALLPNLYHLECFPVTLALLIIHRVPFLSRLTSLSLASTRQDFNDITLLQNAPDIPTLFSSIRQLRFQFPIKHQANFQIELDDGTVEERSLWTDWQNYSSQGQLELMAWAAHQFAQTTSWEGDLPPMHGGALASFFALYLNVEIISLPQRTLLHADPKHLVAFFNPLAHKCCNLKRVIGRKQKYSEKTLDVIYTFIRTGTVLSEIVVERARDATEFIGFM